MRPKDAEPWRAIIVVSGYGWGYHTFQPKHGNTTMTTSKPTTALAELTEKGADVDLVREMIRHMAQRMMDMDVESLCAAAYGGAQSRAREQSQRLPRTNLGDARRKRRAEDPQATQRRLFSRVFRIAPHGREGPRPGDSGGLL